MDSPFIAVAFLVLMGACFYLGHRFGHRVWGPKDGGVSGGPGRDPRDSGSGEQH